MNNKEYYKQRLRKKIVESIEYGITDPENPPKAPTVFQLYQQIFKPSSSGGTPTNPPKRPPPVVLTPGVPGTIHYGSPEFDALPQDIRDLERRRYGD